MNRLFGSALVGLLVASAGCGQELTSGGLDKGEVSAVATDDGTPASSSSTAQSSGPRLSRSGSTASVPRGTIRVQALVVLVRGDGVTVPLTSPGGTASLRIAAPDSALLGREMVRATGYTQARVTFTSVEAEVLGGLFVGPLEVIGTVRVPLSEAVTVEAPMNLEVQGGGTHVVVVDLNAADWLAAVDPLTRTVAAATFRSSVRVRVR